MSGGAFFNERSSWGSLWMLNMSASVMRGGFPVIRAAASFNAWGIWKCHCMRPIKNCTTTLSRTVRMVCLMASHMLIPRAMFEAKV